MAAKETLRLCAWLAVISAKPEDRRARPPLYQQPHAPRSLCPQTLPARRPATGPSGSGFAAALQAALSGKGYFCVFWR